MSEEYVTRNELKDIITAMREETRLNIARIEAKEEASEARCQAQIAEIRGEVKEIRGEVKALASTVSSMKDTVNDMKQDIKEIKADMKSLRYNLIGWTIGFAAVVIAGVQVLLAMRG